MSKIKIFFLRWYEKEKYIKRLRSGYRLLKFYLPNNIVYFWGAFYLFLELVGVIMSNYYLVFKVIRVYFSSLYLIFKYFIDLLDTMFMLYIDYYKLIFIFMFLIFFLV